MSENINSATGSPESDNSGATETVKVRLVLDVTYAPNGVLAQALVDRLQNVVELAVGEGLLTGDTAAEVDEYSVLAAIVPEGVSEDGVADFMRQRIESGDLSAEDIPVRLARYGLMESESFVAEMRERMGLENSASEDSGGAELRPISFSGGQKSISDDDLCASCSNCDYRPGEMSSCKLNWPGLEDPDGYVQHCVQFAEIESRGDHP